MIKEERFNIRGLENEENLKYAFFNYERIPRLGPTIVYCVYTVSAGKYMAISDFIFV